MSKQYHLYCKYFLLNHKPWHENVHNSWSDTISDPEKHKDTSYLEDDNKLLVKRRYVDQICDFQQTIYIMGLEIVHLDVYQLHIIRIGCEISCIKVR